MKRAEEAKREKPGFPHIKYENATIFNADTESHRLDPKFTYSLDFEKIHPRELLNTQKAFVKVVSPLKATPQERHHFRKQGCFRKPVVTLSSSAI